MVGTFEHDEFYDGYFDLWCDKVEEKQKEELRLTESEYIDTDDNNYNEMPF